MTTFDSYLCSECQAHQISHCWSALQNRLKISKHLAKWHTRWQCGTAQSNSQYFLPSRLTWPHRSKVIILRVAIWWRERYTRVKDEITRELKDMVEEENAQLNTFSIFLGPPNCPLTRPNGGKRGGSNWALTWVLISRNSRREITHIFISWSWEMRYHFRISFFGTPYCAPVWFISYVNKQTIIHKTY